MLDSAHIPYIRELYVDYRCVNGGCKDSDAKRAAKVDFVEQDHILAGRRAVLLHEVDESQHQYEEVSCETSRMAKVEESLRMGAPDGFDMTMDWFRINVCDSFSVETAGETQFFKATTIKTQKMVAAERFEKVMELRKKVMQERDSDIEGKLPRTRIHYLFYDTDKHGLPKVFEDPDYPEILKELVRHVTT